MEKWHQYQIELEWTGNTGNGTTKYNSYERSHIAWATEKPIIELSADPAFRGNPKAYNPEELLLMSVASCHMLWYLHLCSVNGVVVTNYTDRPIGKMKENADGSGRFTEIILYPTVEVLAETILETAQNLHIDANKYCFIANSLNFKVQHHAVCTVQLNGAT